MAMDLLMMMLIVATQLASAEVNLDNIDPALLATLDGAKINMSESETTQGWVDLLTSLKEFDDGVLYGTISEEVIPTLQFNESVEVWSPPLETIYYKGPGLTEDVTSVYATVIYEVLSNMTYYGADKVLENVLDVFGMKDELPAVLGLINVGLPTRDELLVRLWKTGFLGDVVEYFSNAMAEQESVAGVHEDPMVGATKVLQKFFSDPDSMVWKDLAVILGPPLGPTIIPLLKSASDNTKQSNATTQQGASSFDNRTQDIFPDLFENTKLLLAKTLLYNPYLPVPCLLGSNGCPEAELESETGKNFSRMYNATLEGELSVEDFADEFQGQLLNYFQLDDTTDTDTVNSSDIAATTTANPILQQLFSNDTGKVGMINENSPPSNHQVDVLNGLALANYSLEIDQDVLETGYAPKTAICLANISAAMYEYPDIQDSWTSGLGLDTVKIFSSSGDLSARGAVFVDKEQNAVVIGYEGVPYFETYFQRGIFGWIRALFAQTKAFEFPCSGSESNSTLCDEMEEKYGGDATIYPGFAPLDSAVVNDLLPALEEAVTMLQPSSSGEKPKLYITGHSLGGPHTKNTLAQILLRGYGEMFSEVNAYAFAPPIVGNGAYLEMIEDLVASSPSANLYQIINAYDPMPYVPSFSPMDKGNVTLKYDLENDRFVREQPLEAFEGMPENVFLSGLGAHSIKTQYLPLARSLDQEYNYETCEELCAIEQCGLYQCQDTCQGVL